MKSILYILIFCFPLVTNSQNTMDSIDMKSNEIVHITELLHYELKEISVVSLPIELGLNSSEGKAVIGTWFDSIGGPYFHTLLFISLKTDTEQILTYRSRLKRFSYESPSPFNIEDFPLPIQPYVLFFKEKLNELEFIENKDIPKKMVYYCVTFIIKNNN